MNDIVSQYSISFFLCDEGVGPGRCDVLSNVLVIIVGGVPIAMPTVVSVTLALGAQVRNL
jgi:magnesium-transporting ATPase (P-type)